MKYRRRMHWPGFAFARKMLHLRHLGHLFRTDQCQLISQLGTYFEENKNLFSFNCWLVSWSSASAEYGVLGSFYRLGFSARFF